MRAAIYTLGCKVNQYETQAMEQELRRRGHELVDFEDSADAYIINTCSVTAVSDKKSRQMIRRARRRSPGAVVAACGCYVQTHTDEAKTLGIDLIGGTGDRMAFLDLLEQEVLCGIGRRTASYSSSEMETSEVCSISASAICSASDITCWINGALSSFSGFATCPLTIPLSSRASRMAIGSMSSKRSCSSSV